MTSQNPAHHDAEGLLQIDLSKAPTNSLSFLVSFPDSPQRFYSLVQDFFKSNLGWVLIDYRLVVTANNPR